MSSHQAYAVLLPAAGIAYSVGTFDVPVPKGTHVAWCSDIEVEIAAADETVFHVTQRDAKHQTEIVTITTSLPAVVWHMDGALDKAAR